VGLQEFFATDPLLLILKDFLAERLSAGECQQKIMDLPQETTAPKGA
jgi:hypothetical protein